jgi:hypothetical protein
LERTLSLTEVKKLEITERIICVGIGGACVVAVAGLLTGATFSDMAMLVTAFGFGSLFPSPIKAGEKKEN